MRCQGYLCTLKWIVVLWFHELFSSVSLTDLISGLYFIIILLNVLDAKIFTSLCFDLLEYHSQQFSPGMRNSYHLMWFVMYRVSRLKRSQKPKIKKETEFSTWRQGGITSLILLQKEWWGSVRGGLCSLRHFTPFSLLPSIFRRSLLCTNFHCSFFISLCSLLLLIFSSCSPIISLAPCSISQFFAAPCYLFQIVVLPAPIYNSTNLNAIEIRIACAVALLIKYPDSF